MPWLEQVEGKLDDFESMDEPGFRRDDSETPADELSHLSEEIAERRLLVDKIVNAGEKLGQMGGIEQTARRRKPRRKVLGQTWPAAEPVGPFGQRVARREDQPRGGERARYV